MSQTQVSSFHDIVDEEKREKILQQGSETSGVPLSIRFIGLAALGYCIYLTWAEPLMCAG